ncbi:protein FAM186A [Dipodomys merriami]|uniref:protein FAM186A n=1 Tax=Dipodomys merriami TaxID=94247 RepID=UPI0038507E24
MNAFGSAFTPKPVQTLWPPLTSAQDQLLEVSSISRKVQPLQDGLVSAKKQALMITPKKARTLGTKLTQQQARASAITPTSVQEPELEVPVTEEQAWKLGVSFIPEKSQEESNIITFKQLQPLPVTSSRQQAQTFHTPQTLEKSDTLVPSTLRPFEELKTTLPTGQPRIPTLTPSLKKSLKSSPQKSSIFKIPPTPLKKSKPPLAQAPIAPPKHLEKSAPFVSTKLMAPGIPPMSRQIPTYRGQTTPAPSLTPEVPSQFEQLLIAGAPATPKQFLTPKPPSRPEAPLTGSLPLLSGVPLTSGQIPRLLAPLSPGQPLIPGAHSIPRKFLESGLVAFSDQIQELQIPAYTEQPSYFQTPTLEQDFITKTLSGQVSPLRISPITEQRTLPTLEKPKTVLSSSTTQKKLATIASLKPKSVLTHPRASDFKVYQAPFTIKKAEISEVSDASEVTWKSPELTQSYLADYRRPVLQTSYIDEALPTLRKPVKSPPTHITQLPKTLQISPSEWDLKPLLPSIDKPGIITSAKILVPPSSPQDLEEKRYFVDVEAQRKNLILLNQVTKVSGLSAEQYTTAWNLITEIIHMDTVRLEYLVRKYIAYRQIQRVRNNIIKRLKAIQNTGKGYEVHDLYIMLSRIDDYQKKVMWVWTEKQKSLEQKRYQNLKKMISLFTEFQEKYNLKLSQPIPLITDKKQIPKVTEFVQRPFKFLVGEDKRSDVFKELGKQEEMEAIWNSDLSTSSYPITEKTSIHSVWAMLGGYPDIPKLLELDIQSTLRKSLANIQSQYFS